MNRCGRLALLVLLAGCERDILVLDDGDARGLVNPPSLETPVHIDEIVQVSPPKVDVLWVIDNSESMADNQSKLARNFPSMAQFFISSGLDWHMGVVSTDMEDPTHRGLLREKRGLRYLDSETEDVEDLFTRLALVGDLGSYLEEGRAAVQAALSDPLVSGYNAGFYREDAFLHVVVISDEDDYSRTPSKNEFIDWMRNLKAAEGMVTFSSIVAPRGNIPCNAVESGLDYLDISEAIGGQTASICERDWAPILEALGLEFANLRQEWFLSEVPVPGSLKIAVRQQNSTFKGIDLDSLDEGWTVEDACDDDECFGYTYDPFRNSVLFDGFIPDRLSIVRIAYELMKDFQPAEDVAVDEVEP